LYVKTENPATGCKNSLARRSAVTLPNKIPSALFFFGAFVLFLIFAVFESRAALMTEIIFRQNLCATFTLQYIIICKLLTALATINIVFVRLVTTTAAMRYHKITLAVEYYIT
jgi:hypothetical protein